ncbi:MAG: glycogen/starch synthase [Prevotella sp.]|nr:glycogen/starch synthase [Prevotella sp.]
MPKKILFINQETVPYVPETLPARMGRGLPERIQEAGYEVRTFMPKWGVINERRGQLHEVIRLSGLNIVVNDSDHPLIIKVASLPVSRVQVYFIDNEEFFSRRRMTLDADGNAFADNGERAVFFARGVLETVRKLRWMPDAIICSGWMTAVVPLYIRTVYADEPCFIDAKIITTLFADGFGEELEEDFKQCIIYNEVSAKTLKEYKDLFDYPELARLAIDYSDGIVAAEPGVSEDVLAYAASREKPVRKCSEEDYAGVFKTFIDELDRGMK